MISIFKREPKARVPEVIPVPVRMEPEVLAIDTEYHRVAQKLGLAIGARERAWARLQPLVETVYEEGKVSAYLKKIAPRTQEFDGEDYYMRRCNVAWVNLLEVGTLLDEDFSPYKSTPPVQYTKAVPFPALLTVERIKETIPEAGFYVSDFIEVPRADPFLLVVVGGERFIVERWDEPSFR